MSDVNQQFIYASGEVAEIGDIVSHAALSGTPLQRQLEGQVINKMAIEEDGSNLRGYGWIDFVITSGDTNLEGIGAIVPVSATRAFGLNLIRRAQLEMGNPAIREAAERIARTKPGYDPSPRGLG